MKKIKSIVALVLVLAMSLTMWGCGSSSDSASSASTDSSAKTDSSASSSDDSAPAAEVNATDDGTVLNIYCWNEEFQSRFKDYYPGYTEGSDSSTGTLKNDLGEFTVNWVITPSDDNAYQNKLDEVLPNNASASADDKVDIFLIEADYALKYVNSDTTVDVIGLGLTDADLAEMYDYTKTVGTNTADGTLRAVSWQATPGLFAYRRSIAKKVLGSDDPDTVQAALATWDDFDAAAAKMKDAGYTMLAGPDDAYRTFSNNVSKKWLADDDKTIQIDDALWTWVDQTKTYVDNGYCNVANTLWSDGWSAEQGSAGKTFGFFYSTWGINFTLLGNSKDDPDGPDEVGNGIFGDWAVCEGPAAYYWGGTWICAAAGTDNKSLVADVMKVLTCDGDVATKITQDTQDYTNNKAAMAAIGSSDYSSAFLGGQNHIALFVKSAEKIDISNMGPDDQGLNESFQQAMADYFKGEATKEDATASFYKAAIEKYPSLVQPE